MLESVVETYLDEQVEKHGGFTRKTQWIGRRGAPDRTIFLRGAHFAECKKPGLKADAHQAREHKRMNEQGVTVWLLDTKDKVDLFIFEVMW